MSWEVGIAESYTWLLLRIKGPQVFRCSLDCTDDINNCIGETLYMQQAKALVDGGYLAAGYKTISTAQCLATSMVHRRPR